MFEEFQVQIEFSQLQSNLMPAEIDIWSLFSDLHIITVGDGDLYNFTNNKISSIHFEPGQKKI